MKIQRLFLICAIFSNIQAREHKENRALPEKKLVVIIPSFNNSAWYEKNLDSVFDQQYTNYRIIYIDDCSPDNTGKLVQDYVTQRGFTDKCTVIQNTTRVGALLNLYRAIHSCADDEIVLTLDGDDWFKHQNVMNVINTVYQNSDIWMTYGQYENYPKPTIGMCKEYPKHIVQSSFYREHDWIASHLRTFYAGLFKRIKLADLVYNNTLFSVTWDLAMMFPMLEMAAGKYRCIKDVLYVYNVQTPLNDYKLREYEQRHCEHIIRAKQKYSALTSLKDQAYKCSESLDVIVLHMTSGMGDSYVNYLRDYVTGINNIISLDLTQESENTSQLITSALQQVTTPYVLIIPDTYSFLRSCEMKTVLPILAQTKAHCFSLSLGETVSDCQLINRPLKTPMCIPVTQDIVAWQFKREEFPWRMPYACDGVVYATAGLLEATSCIIARHIQDFKKAINLKQFDVESVGLCFVDPVVAHLGSSLTL